jgi:hypothetical protein
VEEARFPLVTVHYGTVLRWTFLVLLTKLGTLSLGARVDLLALITKLRYAVPTLVLLVPRKLPTTVITNTESSPVSPYSNLVSCSSTGLLEPKTYTFKYKNKLLLICLNDRAGSLP